MNIEIINHDEVYNRILSGKPYGKDLKPYPEIVLKRVLNKLEIYEEYEKCRILQNFIDKRFIHECDYLLISNVTLNLPFVSQPK